MPGQTHPPPFLPTDDQALLLQACFALPERALVAWQAWRTRFEVDHVDAASRRLLPLLAASLRKAGVETTALAPDAEAQRQGWIRYQALAGKSARAIEALAAAGVPTMMLKGATLAASHYDDPALRPMGDVDMLVRRANGLPEVLSSDALGLPP